MKRLIWILCFIPLFSWGQQLKELTFNETTHDFGLIKEVAGPVEYNFEFTNTSGSPITITNVRPSCGCTSSGWTKEEIAPGGTGFISAAYNPMNRPGPFNKTLTVTTTGQTKTLILRITGQVEPKPRTVEDDFPTLVGAIRVKYRAFNMGRVFNNEPTVKEFGVYNAGEKDVMFLDSVIAPPMISLSFEPTVLKPQERGIIKVSYDAAAKNDLGFMSDNIVFFTNEEGEDSRKSFSVYADVNEYFPPLSDEEKAVAPRLLIEDRIVDFGKLTQGEEVQAQFVLKNDGKSPLNFRKTKSSCGCTVASMPKMDLAPGETITMAVAFDSKGRRGVQQKSVTLYSNDPVNPVQRVTIKAIVEIPNNE